MIEKLYYQIHDTKVYFNCGLECQSYLSIIWSVQHFYLVNNFVSWNADINYVTYSMSYHEGFNWLWRINIFSAVELGVIIQYY